MTAADVTPARRTPTRSMLLGGLLPTLPLLVVVPLLTWAAAGEWAGVSAALGVLLSIVVFALGVVGIRGVLMGPTGATMAGAFGVFILQMAALAVTIWALGQTSWLEVVPLVIAFVITALVFQAGMVIGFLRSRATLDVTLPGEAR